MGLSQQASAQSSAADSERANRLFKKGKAAFNAGKYDDALRIYGEAWSLKQSPDIAANLAQTESELGKHRDAAEHYAFALAHLLPSSTDEQKVALAEGLATEKAEIGTLRVTLEPADSALTIDDLPVNVPTTGEIFVEPGEHRAAVTREGYEPNTQTVRVSKGAAQVLWIRLQQTAASPVSPAPEVPPPAKPLPSDALPPEPSAQGRSLVPAIIGGGLAAAGAAVGVVFLLSANSSQNDADDMRARLGTPSPCGPGTPYESQCSALREKNKDVDHARTVEVAGFAVAGAAAIGTAVYLLWPSTSSTSSTSTSSSSGSTTSTSTSAKSHASSRSRSASISTTSKRWLPSFAIAPGSTSFSLSGCF